MNRTDMQTHLDSGQPLTLEQSQDLLAYAIRMHDTLELAAEAIAEYDPDLLVSSRANIHVSCLWAMSNSRNGRKGGWSDV